MKFHFNDLGNLFEITKIVSLFDLVVTPINFIEKVKYDFWGLVYVERGVLNLDIGDKSFSLSENQLAFYPPGYFQKFTSCSKEECKIWTIRFVSPSNEINHFINKVYTLKSKEKLLLFNVLSIGNKIFRWFGNDSSEHGMYTLETALPTNLYGMKLQLEMLFYTLYTEYDSILKVGEKKKTPKNRMLFIDITNYMQENLDKNLTVDEIAKSFCIGISTLKRLFKEQTGQGVLNYFIDLKIKKALEYMYISEMNFSEMSDALGFSSSFYFSRVFKKKMGMTPTEYRNKVRSES